MSEIYCLELFAGAGGLAMGISRSGVRHKAFLEWNHNACQTLSHNYDKKRVHNLDIRSFNFTEFGSVDLMAGGPPCQPFSMGGKHKGNLDKRDMFPSVCHAIATCTPEAFIFENVKGILRQSFQSYFEYIILRLTYPEVKIKDSEDWVEHRKRLKKIDASDTYAGIRYDVKFSLLNAADYGVPQIRERVFIVGIRDDLEVEWDFPKPTHSLDALLWSQFVSRNYCDRHNIKNLKIENLDLRLQKKIEKIRRKPPLFAPPFQPWQTVRDRIGDLPEPDDCGNFAEDHVLRRGAKPYPGHTGSYIDLPSKALKAGDHGVPGGENMIRYPDGRVRYYTTLEAKRIQTFPDRYKIWGSWTESMRQIGNAVPVELGYAIADSLVRAIWGNSRTAVKCERGDNRLKSPNY